MQIILSHVHTDFDALASMIAAQKLYPEAQIVITDKQSTPVKQFLNIYRDTIDLKRDHQVDWNGVNELILVDTASLARTGDYSGKLDISQRNITVFDHHPPSDGDVTADYGTIARTGAAITLLIEEIQKRSLPITTFEATLFGLGIYTDTGSFTYTHTTGRDLRAAGYLMDQGMDLKILDEFASVTLTPEQQDIFDHLYNEANLYLIDGLEIVVSSCSHNTFQKGLSVITEKLLEMTGADAAITVVAMQKRVFVVGRASSERITLLPLLELWQGGGHRHAGSAMIKKEDRETIWQSVIEELSSMIKQAVTARDMMMNPVKTIHPKTSIAEAGHRMYRYGHSGFPVVQDGKLVGIITRRDLEKANHHGLGHAPVKGFMTTDVISISPDTNEDDIRQIIIDRNIGRLPVVENGELIGIVSRSNIIAYMHHQDQEFRTTSAGALETNLQAKMEQDLPEDIYFLLQKIGESVVDEDESVYLIGGMVRDILLGVPNTDIDLVVEGDGVAFANKLQAEYGGEVITHEAFGTATWKYADDVEIDITSAHLEYYERPAALPNVELSTLLEDLQRRDFTINAMAICLDKAVFGELVDPFRGQSDLLEKKVKILHNLSFVEDPTRIFRGVRFEIRFGFAMDDQTENLARQSADRVLDLTANRIIGEMHRLFDNIHPSTTIHRLFQLGFWQQFGIKDDKQEISSHHADRLRTIYHDAVDAEHLSQSLWFSYFLIPFYQEGNMEAAKDFALSKNDKQMLNAVLRLNENRTWLNVEQAGDLHRLLKDDPDEAILFMGASVSYERGNIVLDYVQRRFGMPTLLTGKDLIEKGLEPGAAFAEILLDLDVAVLNGEVQSEKEAHEWLQHRLGE